MNLTIRLKINVLRGWGTMESAKRTSYYLDKIATLTESTEEYLVYTIRPEIGEGTITIFEIMPGFTLSFNHFFVNGSGMKTDQCRDTFSEPILKINYCLEGKMLVCDKQGRGCVSDKGTVGYYFGNENIYVSDHFNALYRSITLFGFISNMTKVFEQIFRVKKEDFSSFCEKIVNEGVIIAIKSNVKVLSLISKIEAAFLRNDYIEIRLKSIELLLYEIKYFAQNSENSEAYYKRSVVEKIVDIEQYIMHHLHEKITLHQLCYEFDISLDILKRCFKQTFSSSIYAYIKRSRLEKGKTLLENSDQRITEIAMCCGYCNHQSFCKAFKDYYKLTPRETRRLS